MLDMTHFATVRTDSHSGVPVVVVGGELDSTTARPVRMHLDAELDRRPHGLVVDLSELSFIGSTGLQVLIETVLRAREQHTALAVSASRRAVLRPMAITQVDRQVTVHDTVDAAVAAVLRVQTSHS
jgi:anti-sigma B factor antagonist